MKKNFVFLILTVVAVATVSAQVDSLGSSHPNDSLSIFVPIDPNDSFWLDDINGGNGYEPSKKEKEATCPNLVTGGKWGLYLIYIAPYGSDAESYSRNGWGLGAELTLPMENFSGFFAGKFPGVFAGTFGFEYINLMFQRESFYDESGGESFTQQTDQNYFRLFLGMRIGGNGDGFFKPHIGANVALVHYAIRTDVVDPDIFSSDDETDKNLSYEGMTIFGYDVTMGVNWDFSNNVVLGVGAKYLKSFSVPEQLGEGSVRVYPQYFQVYFEVVFSFVHETE